MDDIYEYVWYAEDVGIVQIVAGPYDGQQLTRYQLSSWGDTSVKPVSWGAVKALFR
jgi:hypothetical protein